MALPPHPECFRSSQETHVLIAEDQRPPAGSCQGCGWCGPDLKFRVGVGASPGQELFSPDLSDPVVTSAGPQDRGRQGG